MYLNDCFLNQDIKRSVKSVYFKFLEKDFNGKARKLHKVFGKENVTSLLDGPMETAIW